MASQDAKKNHPFYYNANDMNREDEATAESHVISNLEAQRRVVQTGSGDTYGTAVPGERPILGSTVNVHQVYDVYDSEYKVGEDKSEPKASALKQSDRLRSIIQKAMAQRGALSMQGTNNSAKQMHTRGKSDVHSLLEFIQEDHDEEGIEEDPFATESDVRHLRQQSKDSFALDMDALPDTTSTDRMVKGAMQVQSLFEDASENSEQGSTSSGWISAAPIEGEDLPLLPANSQSAVHVRRSRINIMRVTRKACRRLHRLGDKLCGWAFNTFRFTWHAITTAYFCFAAIPLFAIAWILFYDLGNPHFDFLPGNTTLSWWLNFTGRQLLTLEIARMLQYIFIDGLTLRSKFIIKSGGPLVTLLAIQSRGWPFILCAWSCIDFLMLHGDNAFPRNWLYWVGLRIYSSKVTGTYILNSDLYTRALICLIIVGIATSIKRTGVAIYFGRKTFSEFKPKLEKLLKEICLFAEIAELAENVNEMSREDPFAFRGVTAINVKNSHFDSDEDDTPNQNERKKSVVIGKRRGLNKVGSIRWQKEDTNNSSDDEARSKLSEREEPLEQPSLGRSHSGSLRIKDLLDRWEEPVNKLDKSSEASIRDVLQFRRALELLDENQPFGEAFGEASTRDACILSAHEIYFKILKLTPSESKVPFETLALISHGLESEEARFKRTAILKLFRPEKDKKVPLLAFVQTCDSLYRRLRYFRASVGNATVIDHVLEGVLDYVFSFLLFLIALSVLNFNPWPLLVSFSSLVISFSFAVGQSASKYIEGCLLIAVRRPFDLGDRIVITGSEAGGSPGVANSWFVEDINLYYTTLRFAATNEVCTMANGTLSNSKITNCTRSLGAIIVFDFPVHISALEGNTLELIERGISAFTVDHPRDWDCVLFIRIESVDSNNEIVNLKIAVRHRNGWHAAARILHNRGALIKHLFKICEDLSVNYDGLPELQVHYEGGACKVGRPGLQQYWNDIIQPTNIRNADVTEHQ